MFDIDLTEGLLNWYPNKGDYILINIGKEESPIEAIAACRSRLAAGQRLFVVCENRMGLRFFAGDHDPYTGSSFDGPENYQSYLVADKKRFGGRCYARYEIEDILSQAGFPRSKYRGYSILPGLEMPQQMYAWDYLPEENIEIRYTLLYHNPSSVFLNESKLYDSVIKNGMFHQMANAYLIDCSVDEEFYEINHVTTSVDRGKENATATIIQKDGRVVKKALYPEGNERIQNLIDNTKRLQARGIAVVEQEEIICDEEGQRLLGLSMPYISSPTALEHLRDLIYIDSQQFKKEMNIFLDTILASSENLDDGQQNSDEAGVRYKQAYIDMVPLNCFYIDGKFVFYDQEFAEENYPIKVVLARALDIVYMNDASMEEIVPVSYFLKKYDMMDKINLYRSLGSTYINNLRSRDSLKDFNAKHLADSILVNSNRQRINYSAKEYSKLFYDMLSDTEGKKVFLFGSGRWARKFVAEYSDRLSIVAMLDNNVERQGSDVDGVSVESPKVLDGLLPDEYKVIICVKQYTGILVQLRQMGCNNIGIYDPYLENPYTEAMNNAQVSRINAKLVEVSAGDSNSELDGESKKYNVGYVAGVFDLFHVGHLNILKRAKEHCKYLIVGVVSDEQASAGKSHSPYVNEQERKAIVESCKYVDEAFVLPVAASGTRDVYKKYHFDAQFSGSDYENDSYWLKEQAWLRERGSDLVFFPYTQSTSSSKLKETIERN